MPTINPIINDEGYHAATDEPQITHFESMRPRELESLREASEAIAESPTGGRKAVNEIRFDLIDSKFLWELARVCGEGAKKYDDNNWRNGYPWAYSITSLQKHLHRFLQGKLHDDGPGGIGCHHMAQVAWHAMVLFAFSTDPCYAQYDTRLLSNMRDPCHSPTKS